MTNVLQVPVVNDPALVRPCAFRHILPNHISCPEPGLYMELTIVVLQVVVPKIRIKCFQVDRYSPGADNSSSVIGAVMSGAADVTPAYMHMTADRAKKLSYLTPFTWQNLYYVYKPQKETMKIDLQTLYPRPVVAFMIVLATMYVLKKIMIRVCRNSMHPCAKLILKLMKHSVNFIIGLGCALTLGLFANVVCLAFNVPTTRLAPFSDYPGLVSKLSSGKYELIRNSAMIFDLLLNNLPPTEIKLKEKMENTPFYEGVISDCFDLIQEDGVPKKTVAIFEDVYKNLALCNGLKFVNDYFFAPRQSTVYFRTGLKSMRKLDALHLRIIEMEYRFLLNKYREPCKIKKSREKKVTWTRSIDLQDSVGAFVTLLIALCISFNVLIAEILGVALSNWVKMLGKCLKTYAKNKKTVDLTEVIHHQQHLKKANEEAEKEEEKGGGAVSDGADLPDIIIVHL